MTGHDTHGSHGRRPGHSDPGDAALDAVLTVTSQRLLTGLQAALDIDAGLAAVLATGRTAVESSDADPGGPDSGPGELGAVCQVLAGYLADLDPAADTRTSTPRDLGRSLLYLGAVHRLVLELHNGLLTRTLDRDSADRLVRLIEHNATEVKYLLADERRRGTRRARTQIDAWADVIAGIRGGVTALRPRIRALFDDAGHAAPHEPAPRLPV